MEPRCRMAPAATRRQRRTSAAPRDETEKRCLADIGITLRSARVQKGLTIDQVAQDTRISSRFLEALENEAFEELPAPVYVRGFLRSYANYLHIDAQPLLDRLNAGAGAPVGGPDAFVGGPTPRESQSAANARRPGGSKPFQRSSTQSPAPQRTPNRGAPPPPPVEHDNGYDEADGAADDGWEPQAEPEPTGDLVAAPRRRAFDPAPLAAYGASAEDERYRQRRVAGVLLEREGESPESSRPVRILLLAGGAVIVLFVVLLLTVVLKNGGGSTNVASPLSTPSGGRTPGQVITVGSPSPSAAASSSPGANGTPGATPSGSATAAGTPGAKTATPADAGATTPTPEGGTATPAATNTPAPTPVPTATPVPPTATPAPPTPTPAPTATPIPPTPVPSHPTTYGLCKGGSDCGQPPFTIVCVPNGDVYVEPAGVSQNPNGWPTQQVNRLADAHPGACG